MAAGGQPKLTPAILRGLELSTSYALDMAGAFAADGDSRRMREIQSADAWVTKMIAWNKQQRSKGRGSR